MPDISRICIMTKQEEPEIFEIKDTELRRQIKEIAGDTEEMDKQ